MEHILDQLSKAILSAIDDTRTHQKSIRHMSCDLVRLGNRPERSAGMAYEWCSVICENHERLQDWESLFLVYLGIDSRHTLISIVDPSRL